MLLVCVVAVAVADTVALAFLWRFFFSWRQKIAAVFVVLVVLAAT